MCPDMLAPLASAKRFLIFCPCLHKLAKTGQRTDQNYPKLNILAISSKMRFCRKLRHLKARVLKGFDKHFWLILGNTGQLMAGFWQEIQISRWYMTLKSPFWPFLAIFDPFSDVWALVGPQIRDLWSKSFKIHLSTGVRDGLSHFLDKFRIFAKPYMVALCVLWYHTAQWAEMALHGGCRIQMLITQPFIGGNWCLMCL